MTTRIDTTITIAETAADQRKSRFEILPASPIEGRKSRCVFFAALSACIIWGGLFAGVSSQASLLWQSVSQGESVSQSTIEIGGLNL
jgi:hypothetical protein